MDFYAVLDQVMDLLRQRGRVTYRALKPQFTLDDDQLEALKDELLYAHPQVVDDAGRGLRWTGAPEVAPAPAPAQDRAPLTYTPPRLAEKILTSRTALEGERKQVTVLFADIKDSTELIKDLDPEAAQQLLDPAIHIMMDAVHRFEGTVNQVLGDGIMALFGAPIAHEDHALRACYAALAMQAAMQPYAEEVRRRHGVTLRVRVGLNTGEAVVRAIGNDLHMDYSAVGQTVHLAARMEQLAPPGSILLTAVTLRLVEGLVRVTALGPLPVKGFAEPVEGYELVGVSPLRRRLQAAALRGLTRFIGREPELAALTQALARARVGHGQVVALVGAAGAGKSRLVYECLHSPHTQGWRVLEAASVSYGKATPYFPVIDLLKRYAQVDDHDNPRIIRAKVSGHVLTLDEALQEALPALLSLLEALPEDSPFLKLDPPQRRQRTLAALQRLLLRESQVQPLLLVFEDLHWIDSETQALLDSLVERLPTARLLLLVNYRPEYQHGWGSKTYYTQLRLDPLPPASAAEILPVLLGDDPSLTPLKQFLIERTEGNLFFLEESVRTLVETGVLVGEPGTYRLAQALPTIQVPATVPAVLAARIDRLPPEDKRLLQTAAVIGHEVPLPLVQSLAELPETDLHRGLAHLQAAEFLYETRLFPEREFMFKHALTHEVAYGSVLQERRRVLHARIVEALEALYPDRLTEQADRLAHHIAECLAELGSFAEGRGMGEDAMRLAEVVEQPYSLFFAYVWLGLLSRFQGDIPKAIPRLERGLALCQSASIPLHFPLIASSLSAAYALVGRAAEALPLPDQVLEHVASGSRMGFHAFMLTELTEACLLVGRVEDASVLAGHLLEISRAYTGSGYQAHGLRLLGDVAMRREPPDVDQDAAHYHQALALAEELGMRPLQAHCHLGLGTLYAKTGQREQAHAALSTAIDLYRAIEMTFWLPQAEAVLAQVGRKG